jgi:hypothetical protein
VTRQIRVKVLLNKGKSGISLHKLPKLLSEIQQFLDMLGRDVIGDEPEWVGFDFSTTHSLGYTAIRSEPVEEEQAEDFNQAFRSVVRRNPNERIRLATLSQYAKIAEPIEPDETVDFSLDEKVLDSTSQNLPADAEWLVLTKQIAALIAMDAETAVRAFGSVQGIIHSVFMGAKPPHFNLRELSSNTLVKCVYDKARYPELAHALQRESAVLHVYGSTVTDMANRKIVEMKVQKIEISQVLSPEDFERFFGCALGLTGNEDLQEIIERSRSRG